MVDLVTGYAFGLFIQANLTSLRRLINFVNCI